MNKLYGSRRRPVCCLFCLALLASTGCSAGTGAVAGTVTYQGKTVASGTVLIVASDSLPYYGTIQDDGTYTVLKVPTGPAKMAVLSPGPDAGKNFELILKVTKRGFEGPDRPPAFRGDPKKWFPLPDKYREFNDSGLTVTVTGGVNQRDIPLSD
jgi:hypothetical protein